MLTYLTLTLKLDFDGLEQREKNTPYDDVVKIFFFLAYLTLSRVELQGRVELLKSRIPIICQPKSYWRTILFPHM